MENEDRKRPGAKEILFKDNAGRELKPRHVARRDHAPRGATGILIAGEDGAPPRAADVPRAPRPGRGPGRGPDRDQGPEGPVPPRPGYGRAEERDLARERERERGRDMPRPLPP